MIAVIRFPILAVLGICVIAAQTGCATPSSLTSHQRENLGTIGVAAVRFVPGSKPDAPNTPLGGAAGAVVGTTAGALAGVGAIVILPIAPELAFAHLLGYAVAAAAGVGGLAGGVAGATAKAPPKFPDTEAAIATALSQLRVEERLRDEVVEYASKKLPNSFVAVPEILPAVRATPVSYSNVVPKNVDGVLEISLLKIDMRTEGESLLALTMVARARVVRVSDDKVLADAAYRFVSETRSFEIWAENDAEAFREAMERGYQSLAEQIVAGILNRCSGIFFRDCAIPKTTSRDATEVCAGDQRCKT